MIQTTALILGAVIVAGITFFVGLLIGAMTSECYKGKRICHECLRGIVKHGFGIDGKDYEAVCRGQIV